MAQKLYDIAIKTDEYQDRQTGETKGKWQNIGVVIQGDNGPYMLLERWFNPAGIANPDNRSNVMLSLFKPKNQQGQQQGYQQQSQPQNAQNQYQQQRQQNQAHQQYQAPQNNAPAAGFDDFDDDIPFLPYEYRTIV